MVDITAVRMSSGGTRHEHIESVRWRNPDTGASDESTRAQMVEFIDGGGQVSVVVGNLRVEVRVVRANPPYIQTYADGKLQDNLLSLTRY